MGAAGYGQLNLEESPSWGSRNIDCFEKLEQIGEGTYGYFSFFTLLSFFLFLIVCLYLLLIYVQNLIFI